MNACRLWHIKPYTVLPGWRNWQTRKIQVLVHVSGWRFKSSPGHLSCLGIVYDNRAAPRRYDTEPFKPFVLHLASGERIPVHSPEFMLPPPVGRTFVIYQPDGTMNIVDLLLVTHLEFKPGGNGKRKRRPA